jgi:CO dehydrogenase nickel-insertion accessory protein CooC1
MIIGCMGKGGSGKSTVATGLVRVAHAQSRKTLAIDADHNMDLVFNLMGETADFPFLGSHRDTIRSTAQLYPGETYRERFIRGGVLPEFMLDPVDAVTQSVTREILPGLRLMAAGPHTDEVRQGHACSHVLASPLKWYLPNLHDGAEQAIIIDSTAGMDMVGSGIAVGMDLVYIVAEPTIHSTKTAKQIAEGLKWFNVPHVFVVNKVQQPEQVDQAAQWLGEAPMFVLSFTADAQENETIFGEMIRYAEAFARSSGGAAVRRARAAQGIQDGVDQTGKNG